MTPERYAASLQVVDCIQVKEARDLYAQVLAQDRSEEFRTPIYDSDWYLSLAKGELEVKLEELAERFKPAGYEFYNLCISQTSDTLWLHVDEELVQRLIKRYLLILEPADSIYVHTKLDRTYVKTYKPKAGELITIDVSLPHMVMMPKKINRCAIMLNYMDPRIKRKFYNDDLKMYILSKEFQRSIYNKPR